MLGVATKGLYILSIVSPVGKESKILSKSTLTSINNLLHAICNFDCYDKGKLFSFWEPEKGGIFTSFHYYISTKTNFCPVMTPDVLKNSFSH